MKNEYYVCGIDGGGTKTTAICRNLQGEEIARRVFGPLNLNSIGEEAFRELLNEIVLFLRQTGNCRALCIGAAGTTNSRVAECVKNTLSATGIPYRLLGDYEIAHTGALDGKQGIILISGTGSVCFGKTAHGRTAMAGGWGHLLGDEGSGYGLGHDALRAVSRLYDGYGEPTILKDLLAQKCGLNSQEKIVTHVYSNDKSAVAALSFLVDEAFHENDPVAVRIVNDNAKALADLVLAVSNRLELNACKVALLGGLLENPTPLRAQLIKLLDEANPMLKCTQPLHGAAEGAVMEAFSLYMHN